MTRARYDATEYEIVRFTDNAEWVLRLGDDGEIDVVDADQAVEVRCDFCGQWVTHAGPVAANRWDSWMCFGGTGSCEEEN